MKYDAFLRPALLVTLHIVFWRGSEALGASRSAFFSYCCSRFMLSVRTSILNMQCFGATLYLSGTAFPTRSSKFLYCLFVTIEYRITDLVSRSVSIRRDIHDKKRYRKKCQDYWQSFYFRAKGTYVTLVNYIWTFAFKHAEPNAVVELPYSRNVGIWII